MGLFRRNKKAIPVEDDICAEKMHNKAMHINKNWAICILLIVVIILSAVIISSNLFEPKKVSTIISFTATILSIVLSLLAILYSYLGNIESFDNLSEIRTAVAEIKATEEGIKHFMSNIPFGNGNGGSIKASNKVEEETEMKQTPANNTTAKVDGSNASVVGNAGPAPESTNETTENQHQ